MGYDTGYREAVLGAEDGKPRRNRRRSGGGARTLRTVGRIGGSPVRNGVLALIVATTATAVVAERMASPGEINSELARTIHYSPGMTVDGESLSSAWWRAGRDAMIEEKVQRFRAYRLTPEVAGAIYDMAVQNDIDPEIAFGLVRAESSFRNTATSPVGAVGLAQLMPRTAAWMVPGTTRRDLRNPETNLDIGFQYLRYLLDKYEGNEDLALLAYNRGPGTVDRLVSSGLDPDNGYAAFVRGEAGHGHTLFSK